MKKILLFLLIWQINLQASVDEKVSRLFVIPVSPALGEPLLTEARKLIQKAPFAGIILMQGTLASQLETIQDFQNQALAPLLCFQDAEWGLGMRVSDVPPLPKARIVGAMQDEAILEMGREIGRQCRLGGIQWDLAPVADVNNNPLNPVIGARSFGDDPERVARAALLVMQGMQEMGVLTCAKHFPGHGDTMVDSHQNLPVIPHTLERMKQVELVPFVRLIEAGVDAVMIGHLAFPALEPTGRPATLSHAITTDLLRKEMGFNGLIITDALNMGALEKHYSPEEIAVLAFEAGCDLLLYSDWEPAAIEKLYKETIPRAIEGLKEAYRSGRITEAEIDERIERIKNVPARVPVPVPEI